MRKKIDKKYTGVETPDMKKGKFFLKWVKGGYIKTVETTRGIYYINPATICSISEKVLVNRKQTLLSLVGSTFIFLDIEKEKFFRFLTTKPEP